LFGLPPLPRLPLFTHSVATARRGIKTRLTPQAASRWRGQDRRIPKRAAPFPGPFRDDPRARSQRVDCQAARAATCAPLACYTWQDLSEKHADGRGANDCGSRYPVVSRPKGLDDSSAPPASAGRSGIKESTLAPCYWPRRTPSSSVKSRIPQVRRALKPQSSRNGDRSSSSVWRRL
jgi:hypothetical protein